MSPVIAIAWDTISYNYLAVLSAIDGSIANYSRHVIKCRAHLTTILT